MRGRGDEVKAAPDARAQENAVAAAALALGREVG